MKLKMTCLRSFVILLLLSISLESHDIAGEGSPFKDIFLLFAAIAGGWRHLYCLASQVVVDQMEERVDPEFVSKISTTGFIHRISLAVEYDSDHADDVNEPWKWILDTQESRSCRS